MCISSINYYYTCIKELYCVCSYYIFDHYDQENSGSRDGYNKCSVWGPASAPDKIADDVYLPSVELGDWLYYEDMGAYTLCLDCNFNGFPKPVVYYFITESHKYVIVYVGIVSLILDYTLVSYFTFR